MKILNVLLVILLQPLFGIEGFLYLRNTIEQGRFQRGIGALGDRHIPKILKKL